MKKIICSVTNDLNYDQRMIRICNSLAKAGYEVLLVGREKKNSSLLTPRPFLQKRLSCLFEKGKLFYIEYNIRLFFFLLFRKVDILCAVDLDTILPAFFIGKLRKKILVYDAHEYFTEVPEVIRRPVIQKIWEKIAQSTLPRIQYAYTVGPALAQLMTNKYGIHFEVIRNVPAESNPIPVSAKTGPKVLLYQGVLNEGRGLEYAIEAMKYLPEMELWLIGEGDLSESLRDLSHSLQLEKNVRFWGFQKPEDLVEITAQAYLGINLLENKGLSYYYSLANKCFDYIQAGIPSLQMDFPEYRRLNDEYEAFILLKKLTPESIAEIIKNLLVDEEKYLSLHSNCLKARRELNWEKEEVKLLEFYKKIV